MASRSRNNLKPQLERSINAPAILCCIGSSNERASNCNVSDKETPSGRGDGRHAMAGI